MRDLSYTRNGDYLIPNLAIDASNNSPLGKYGRMRLNFLKK